MDPQRFAIALNVLSINAALGLSCDLSCPSKRCTINEVNE
jgi:hypothetical protein